MTRSILVVAAHPDDEILGCGGTIAKLVNEGALVRVAFLADGVFSREIQDDARKMELKKRRESAKDACEIIGAKSVFFGDFSDNQMDGVALIEVVRVIENLVAEFQPDTIFTHHAGDLNIDHRRVHEAVVTACRPQRNHPVRLVLCFEVPSSTEWQFPGSAPAFVPNWFVDISSTLERKLTALDAYASEMRPWPHPRSRKGVEHLACWRGATIGVNAAEAFVLGRQLA